MLPSNKMPLCIGFNNFCSDAWIAGCNYLSNIMVALQSLAPEVRPQIAIINTNQSQLGQELGSLRVGPDAYRQLSFMPRQTLSDRLWSKLLRSEDNRHKQYAEFLRKSNVHILFTKSMGKRETLVDIPVLAWIPDFQHLHLPEMFSQDEIENRNKHFWLVAEHASCVIVSSHTALEDFQKFAPNSEVMTRVLSFVAQVDPAIYDEDPSEVCRQYHLPERFVYLPNQFWTHKNHRVVVEATAIAKRQNKNIAIVCTGNIHDYRQPDYFQQLLSRVSELGIWNNFIILGMIPYSQTLMLARQSLAVLQPSKFEGWSTIVEECKSLGKAMIVSDIPVHQEQHPPASMFFEPNDPEVLAIKILQIFDEKVPGPDYSLEQQARNQLTYRTQQYGQTFINIVNEVTQPTDH